MKHALAFFAFVLVFVIGEGQVTLICNPPIAPVSLDQLWSVSISSNIVGGNQYALRLQLFDNNQGKVIEQLTSFFPLQPNLLINEESIRNYGPVTNVFTSQNFVNKVTKEGGVLPNGNYTLSYTLFNKINSSIGEEVAHAECPLNIDNSYLLQLITPPDKSIIQELLPVFNWVYTGTLQEGCQYEFTLKEILKNQSPGSAMLYNQVYATKLINDPLYVYEAFDRPLQQERHYCWMVKIKCGGQYVAVSEIWSFSTSAKANELPKIDPNSFFKIKAANEGSEVIVDDNYLKIKYIQDFVDKDGWLEYQLLDAKGKNLLDTKSYPLKVSVGDNRYIIELCPAGALYLRPGRYSFNITDDKGVKYTLRFINKPKVNCE